MILWFLMSKELSWKFSCSFSPNDRYVYIVLVLSLIKCTYPKHDVTPALLGHSARALSRFGLLYMLW